MPDATGLSAGGGIPPPGVDPQQWYQQARAQMLASALMQGAFSPVESPQTAPVRGIYVQPRVGLGQIAAKLGDALMANSATKRAMQLTSANMGQAVGAMAPGGQYQPTGDSVTVQTAPGQQVAPPSSPDEQSVQPPGGATPPQTAQVPTFSRTPVNPMNPTGMPASIALRAYMQDPAGYFKMIQGTPEWQNALRATGGDPSQAQQLIAAQLRKAGTTEARPGGWVQGPNGEWQQLPAGGPGQQLRLGPNGEITSSTIPGYNEQAGALEAAQTGAKEANTPIKLGTDANGRDIYGFPTPPGWSPSGAAAPSSPGAPAAPAAAAPPAPLNATAPGQTASPAVVAAQETGAKNGQDFSSELAKNAAGSVEILRSLSELKNLAGQATPTASNAARSQLGAYMIAAGASPETVSKFLGVDVGAIQAAQKQTAQLAVANIHSMTSRGTNFDLDTFIKNNPNLNMADPAAFGRVADYMTGKATQDILKQQEFNDWKGGKSPDQWESGFTSYWNQKQRALIDAGKTNSRPPLTSFLTGQ